MYSHLASNDRLGQERNAPPPGHQAERLGPPCLRAAVAPLPQAGGTYLGPDNVAAGRDLGEAAAHRLTGKIKRRGSSSSLEALPNTRARCDGFLAGFGDPSTAKSATGGSTAAASSAPRSAPASTRSRRIPTSTSSSASTTIRSWRRWKRRTGSGSTRSAASRSAARAARCSMRCIRRQARRLLRAVPGDRRGARRRRARRRAVRRADAGGGEDAARRAHAATISATTTGATTAAGPSHRSPAPRRACCRPPRHGRRRGPRRRPRIGFVPHYPAHDWYRNMQPRDAAPRRRAGLELTVAAPQAGIAREIQCASARVIARAAAAESRPATPILINPARSSLLLADELPRGDRDITVVTNSLDVLERLAGRRGLKVILTSGELHAKARCLVGPSLGALFETLQRRQGLPCRSTASRRASARPRRTSGWRSPRGASSTPRARSTSSPTTRSSARTPTTASSRSTASTN